MLVIRFRPIGKKNQPTYRIVVTEKTNASRAGRQVERLGFYNPLTKQFFAKKERVLYWLSKGAKCSDTVHNLLVKNKVIEGKKIDVHKKSKKPPEPSAVKVATGEALGHSPSGIALKGEAKLAEAPKAPEAPKPAETPKPEQPKPVEKVEEKKPEAKPEAKPEEKKEEKPVEKKPESSSVPLSGTTEGKEKPTEEKK